ncbi:MAG: DUF4123 domain-containing protein [Roseomonas sp.]|nr:DUF4123 domain-containing protein [Roseomonas sp.]
MMPPRSRAAASQPLPIAAQLRRAAGAPLFMVVDAARDAAVLPALAALEQLVEIACLWQGEAAVSLADVAPYLLAVPPGGQADGFVASAWGSAWGIFAATDVPMARLRRHLRRFTLVRVAGGEVMNFRLYDPRVLRDFLPACDAAQRGALFRDIGAFLAEDATGDSIRRYRATAEGGLRMDEILAAGQS